LALHDECPMKPEQWPEKIQYLCQRIPDQPTESIEIPSPIHRRLLAWAGPLSDREEEST
jgi:hypothetical protein